MKKLKPFNIKKRTHRIYAEIAAAMLVITLCQKDESTIMILLLNLIIYAIGAQVLIQMEED